MQTEGQCARPGDLALRQEAGPGVAVGAGGAAGSWAARPRMAAGAVLAQTTVTTSCSRCSFSFRRKLGDDAEDPTYIFTQLRVGYRMPMGEEEA